MALHDSESIGRGWAPRAWTAVRALRELGALAVAALCLWLVSPAQAVQPDAPPVASEPAAAHPVTADQIAALRQRLEAEPESGEAIRAALDAADTALARQAEYQAAVMRSQQEIDNAPAALAATRAALAAPAPDPAASVPADAPLAELERLLTQAQAQLEASRGQLTATEAEPAARQRRREAIPGELAEAQRVLDDARAAANTPAPDGTPALLAEAQHLANLASVQAALARIDALQRELASLDARRENVQARIDLARRQVGEAEALLEHLQARVSQAQRDAAQRAAEEARRAREDAANAHPLVQQVLATNESLAARVATDAQTGALGAQELADQAREQADAARLALASLADDYRSTIQRVDTIGLTDNMGRLLREQRRRLESPLDLEADIEANREALAAVLLELFELRPLEERSERPGPAAEARALAARVPGLSDDDRAALEESLRRALITRLDTVRELIGNLARRQTALETLDRANTARLALLRAYIEEIDRTILWVPSHHPVNARDPGEIAAGFRWINDPRAWVAALSGPGGVVDDIRERPAATLGFMLLVLLFALFGRTPIARVTDRLHERARRVSTDSFRLTIQALVLGALIAAVVPGLLLAMALILAGAGDASEQARAVGRGLLTAASVLFGMLLLRRLTRRGGLAEVHFRWPDDVTTSIRSWIRLVTPVALLTLPLIDAMSASPDTPGGPALTRLALVVWLVTLAIALYRLLRPRGPAISHFLRVSPGGWVDRLRYIWYPLAFGAPLALAIIALLGYVETARELQRRFADTLGLVLALILVSALVTRWITLARRRVAMEAARRRREALSAEHAKQLGGEPATGAAPAAQAAAEQAEHGANLEEIDSQTRQLLRFGVGLTAIFGIWALWVGVLPALGMLERLELWPNPRLVEKPESSRPWEAPAIRALTGATITEPNGSSGQGAPGAPSAAATTPAAQPGASPSPQPASPGAPSLPSPTGGPATTPVAGSSADGAEAVQNVFTLADLLAVVVLALATLVAARNVPGVVEILLLQHLPLDRGSRYAITTIFRYTILIVGVSLTLNAVGIEWGSIQWLAAALTFGLGFGLQEIFANFVSGLIILAERPIRIGDVVTVNNTTGGVSRIRMRATTITDLTKRELIVPNRAFITEPIINWTLTDPSIQLLITIGVAYGSDVNLVRDTLVKVAKASTYLMPGAEPVAIFTGFGQSTLDFELRLWAREVATSHLAKDELLRGIDRAFRENNIQIAFPQQDINIRSINLPPGVTIGRAATDQPPAGSAGPSKD